MLSEGVELMVGLHPFIEGFLIISTTTHGADRSDEIKLIMRTIAISSTENDTLTMKVP